MRVRDRPQAARHLLQSSERGGGVLAEHRGQLLVERRVIGLGGGVDARGGVQGDDAPVLMLAGAHDVAASSRRLSRIEVAPVLKEMRSARRAGVRGWSRCSAAMISMMAAASV